MGMIENMIYAHEKKTVLKRMNGQLLSAASRHDGTDDFVLGGEGALNVIHGDIVITCGAREVFRTDAKTAFLGELMSLDGVTIRGVDKTDGVKKTVTAYYKYHRKVK